MADVINSMSMISMAQKASTYLQTGYFMVDMILTLFVMQVMIHMFQENVAGKMCRTVWNYFIEKDFEHCTHVRFNPREPDLHIRNGSQAAYQFLYDFFCEQCTTMDLKSRRLLVVNPDRDFIHRWNADSGQKQILAISSFEWRNFRVQFGEESEDPDRQEDKHSRKNSDSLDQDITYKVYSIKIWHHTIQDMDHLFDEIMDFIIKRHKLKHDDVNFQYYVSGNKKDLEFSFYNSKIQAVELNSITLPTTTKKLLESTLRDFKHRKGYYDPKHVNPHRMVFLIHGKPGNGKTSFIKMLINYFQIRQVRVIPSLSVFKNDDQLRQTFFGQGFCSSSRTCTTQNTTKNLKDNTKMVVFEEIDAGDKNKVLQDRKIKAQEKKHKTQQQLEQLLNLNSEKKQNALNPQHSNTSTSNIDNTLTLSGWLDVFDGLMALEDVIVVISTNNLKYLDPAVRRRRRVTQIIEFGSVTTETFLEFVNQHFETKALPEHNSLCQEVLQLLDDESKQEISHAGLFDAYYSCSGKVDKFFTLIHKQLCAK